MSDRAPNIRAKQDPDPRFCGGGAVPGASPPGGHSPHHRIRRARRSAHRLARRRGPGGKRRSLREQPVAPSHPRDDFDFGPDGSDRAHRAPPRPPQPLPHHDSKHLRLRGADQPGRPDADAQGVLEPARPGLRRKDEVERQDHRGRTVLLHHGRNGTAKQNARGGHLQHHPLELLRSRPVAHSLRGDRALVHGVAPGGSRDSARSSTSGRTR